MCGEIKQSKFFPFPKRQECYICYEKVTGTYQKAFRQKLGLDTGKPGVRKAITRFVCTVCWQESPEPPCNNCKSQSGYVVPSGYVSSVKAQPKPKKPVKKTLKPVAYDAIDQNLFEQYLRTKTSLRQPVTIRYQSQRKNSAKKWRVLYLAGYDATYLLAASESGVPYRYRRDRVVEYK